MVEFVSIPADLWSQLTSFYNEFYTGNTMDVKETIQKVNEIHEDENGKLTKLNSWIEILSILRHYYAKYDVSAITSIDAQHDVIHFVFPMKSDKNEPGWGEQYPVEQKHIDRILELDAFEEDYFFSKFT